MRFIYVYLTILLSTFLHCKNINNTDLKIFKYNQASGITSLDPAFAKNQANIWAVSQMYNGLVQLDENLEIAPLIAKYWGFSNEGKTITFTLRDDVYFHESEVFKNGTRRVVAQDFVYSFSRIMDSKVASPGAWIFNGKIDTSKAFIAIDDSTFQLNLTEAFGPMLGVLTMPYCFVVPKEAIDKFGADFRAHVIGTGPFKLKIWEEGTALVALKNKNYFEKDVEGNELPYLDGFKINFTESKKMEYLNFMKGNLDMLSGVDKSFVEEIFNEEAGLKEKWKESLILYKSPFLNTEYLGFNLDTEDGWLKNKKFRQAINYCFDKQEMIQYLRKGVGVPAENGFIPKGLPAFNEHVFTGYSYQPIKAKQLLNEINYDGAEISLSTNETYKDIALYISNEAKKVGINIKVDVVQPSLLREWMMNGQVDFFRGSWIADYPDSENYLSLFYSNNGAPPNYTRFKNAWFDKMYVEASTESDFDKRIYLYQNMDSIIIDEAPVVFLYYDEIIRLTHHNISGAKPNALNLLDIKYIKKD